MTVVVPGSTTLDSWMGTDHGIYPWDNTLVMGKFDGVGVLGGLWMVFLWGPVRGGTGTGKKKRLVTFIRVVFRWTLAFSNIPKTSPFFMLHVIY